MRTSFIVARVNGQPHVFSGGRLVPVDIADPVSFFKKVVGEGKGIDGAEALEVWSSDCGITKRAKFKPASGVVSQPETFVADIGHVTAKAEPDAVEPQPETEPEPVKGKGKGKK